MKKQRGYTLIELLIALSIASMAILAAGMAIYQVLGGTEDANDRITAVHQVQNAGYWMSRDAQMAVSVNATTNLSFPGFLRVSWTEWDSEGSSVYHVAEYTLVDGVDNLYTLKRNHTSTSGANDETMIANYIYYDPGEEYTSDTTYDNPVITITLTSIFDDMRESREYRIKRRAGL